jgi:hypothetical protein
MGKDYFKIAMHFFLFVSGNPRFGKNTLATIAENYGFTTSFLDPSTKE